MVFRTYLEFYNFFKKGSNTYFNIYKIKQSGREEYQE